MINTILNEDVLTGLNKIEAKSIHCCVTSPPYYALRDYKLTPTNWPAVTFSLFGMSVTISEQECCLGLEKTPMEFVGHLVLIFRKVKEALRDDGTLWLNLGDSYAGSWGNYSPHSSAPLEGWSKSRLDRPSYDDRTWRPPNSKKLPNLKTKDLIGIPWMVAFALRDDGWYLRSDIIWYKRNPMPESVTDRPTKSHEYIFLMSKSEKYYYDHKAIMQDVENQMGSDRVPGKTNGTMKAKASWNGSGFDRGKTGEMMQTRGGIKNLPEGQERLANFRDNQRGRGSRKSGNKERKDRPCAPEGNGKHQMGSVPWEGMKANKRTVWDVTTKPFKEAHFATFPEDLIVDPIKAGCPEGGTVLDPFMGAGTTALVARKLNRNFIGFELNPEYINIAEKRLDKELGMFK